MHINKRCKASAYMFKKKVRPQSKQVEKRVACYNYQLQDIRVKEKMTIKVWFTNWFDLWNK